MVKTKDSIIIPLPEKAKEILERYSDKPKVLPIISHQKTNDYLKKVCKLTELKEVITLVRYRGGERIETAKPKYELVTTHTVRRTFVTLSLEKGMRAEVVMKITGHQSYKIIQKYLKITDKVAAIEMRKTWEPEKILQIVNL